jgi:hypothetical protein
MPALQQLTGLASAMYIIAQTAETATEPMDTRLAKRTSPIGSLIKLSKLDVNRIRNRIWNGYKKHMPGIQNESGPEFVTLAQRPQMSMCTRACVISNPSS